MYPYPMLLPSKRFYPYGNISPKTQGCDCGEHINKRSTTGNSLSEALILRSLNPKDDDRLFAALRVQYKKTTSSVHIV